MITPHHGDDAFRGCHQGRAVHGMLKYGAGADEGAILFGPVESEPAMNEWLHPGAFASRKDDGPAGRGWVLLIHDVPLTEFGGQGAEGHSGNNRLSETCSTVQGDS